MAKREEIIVSTKGVARGIVSPLVERVAAKLGTPEIERASHVEPWNELSAKAQSEVFKHDTMPAILAAVQGKWFADLLKQEGGSVLGPFDTRQEALAAEETWLRERNIPICGPCRG